MPQTAKHLVLFQIRFQDEFAQNALLVSSGNSPSMLCLLLQQNPKTAVKSSNRQARQIFGFNPETLISLTDTHRIKPKILIHFQYANKFDELHVNLQRLAY